MCEKNAIDAADSAAMNPYEKAREERIKRNNAMLAQLEVCMRARKGRGCLLLTKLIDLQRPRHIEELNFEQLLLRRLGSMLRGWLLCNQSWQDFKAS